MFSFSEQEVLLLSRSQMLNLHSKIIRRTRTCSVETLIGVYAQLDKCVRKYREKWDRSKLEQVSRILNFSIEQRFSTTL